ncbi:MAG TPA: tRNA glutamyl-Q(34) synthetase GluQRS [Terriglobales bacterium]|nr:tRNA glutamyl-Q(34) synthetase GluQRS [Terriglobales bacterium]
MEPTLSSRYRGRLAPSPTGYLHLGHARTFWIAYQRALANRGTLILRNEDLDPQRSKREYTTAMLEDLRWFGIRWQEGPDCGGPVAPYSQSERRAWYLKAWQKLRQLDAIYPCTCSRKDLSEAAQAPHADNDEALYPGTCRSNTTDASGPAGVNWRFRVPDRQMVRFNDGLQDEQQFTAGVDFGDFVVWRRDDVPAYQLAVVVDDSAMGITEVVRGCDLLKSTARQLLLFSALDLRAPDYYHCDLLTDARGQRLAKRHDSLSLRTLRASGVSPESLRNEWKI